MFEMWMLMMVLTAGMLVVPLIKGAKTDWKERKFPAAYWEDWWQMGGLMAVMFYMVYLIANGNDTSQLQAALVTIVMYLIIAIVAGFGCYFMGMRFGSGGDWRALMYIAIITPFLFLLVLGLALLFGYVHGIIALIRSKSKGESIFLVTIPWAVDICAAYVVSLIVTVWMWL